MGGLQHCGMNRSVGFLVLLVFSTTLWAAERLPRLDLLKFRDTDGNVQPVKTPADWAQRRAEIVRGMETVMGSLPGKERRVDLAVKVEEEVDAGKYIRRLITYQSEPDSRTPAYLCIPKAVLKKGKAPAVLCLMPTDNRVGHLSLIHI